MIHAEEDGAVELYFDNSKKIETTSGGLNVTGITTISDRLQVTSGISTFYDTTQSTSSTTGAGVLDGGLGVAKNVNIGGNLTVTGTTTLNGGTVTLGDADTDNVVFSADVDSNIIPDDDDTYDLGSSTKEWNDLFIDGTAHIDVLDVDETAFVTTKLTVGTGVTIQNHGGVSIAGVTTVGGNLSVNSGHNFTLTSSAGAGTSTIVFDSSAGDLTFDDNIRLKFGNSDDLAIYHDGSDNYIDGNSAAEDHIYIRANVGSDQSSNIHLQAKAGEESIVCRDDEQVELYHNGNLRVSTTVDGAKVGTGVTLQTNGNLAAAGIVTANGGLLVGSNAATGVAASIFTNGNATFSGIVTTKNLVIADSTQGRIFLAGANSEVTNDGNLSFNTSSNVLTINGSIDLSTDIDVDGTANLDVVDVDGAANFADDVTLVASIGAGSSTVLFDSSAGTLTFQDNIRANFGTGSDLSIFHNGTNSFITNDTGNFQVSTNEFRVKSNNGTTAHIQSSHNGNVQLYNSGNLRLETTTDGVDFGGTGSIKVPVGTTAQRNSSPAAGDFRYNSDEGKFEGYTNSWGEIGGGSVEETDTSVSTTSATSTGSFAKADFRSAAIIAQITQGSNYQVGRYLLIHDGTTVTTIEESAVATGSMLGTFEGVINGSNVEFRVTMGSSSSATVTTKIDTVTV